MSILNSIRTRLGARSPEAVHATAHAAHTVAGDLDRSADRVEGADTAPSLAALGIRALATARSRTRRRAARLSRTAAIAAGSRQRQLDHRDRREQRLLHPRTAERLGHAVDHDVRSARIGYLASWLPGLVVVAVAIGMVANDPPFVAATLRRTFDIPESTPLWAVWDPNVLVSLAAAVIVTVMLLGGAHLLGKAGASLLFRGPLLRHPQRYREVVLADGVLPVGRSIAILGLGGAVLGFFVWFLHTIAEERFTGGITAAFSGQSGMGVETAVTLFVTWLPVAVVVLEVIANHPVFAHAREAAKWSRRLRLVERIDTWRDSRLARRAGKALRRARIAMANLADMIGDVALRTQAEFIEAALVTGKLDAGVIGREFGIGSGSAHGTAGEQQQPHPRIDLSGRVHAGVVSTPIVSNRVSEAIAAFRSVDEAPEVEPIAKLWSAARDAARRTAGGDEQGEASAENASLHGLHPVDDTPNPTTTAAEEAA